MKQKVLSILALLLMTATGAWADTTVTWTASDMSGIYIDFCDDEAYNNTIKGIKVTASGGGMPGDGWDRTDINLDGGSTTITFNSSVGNIKSIAIKAYIDMSSTPSGWTTDYNSELSWSGEASTTVSLPLSGRTEISDISEIVFTIESSTVNITGITINKTVASMTVGGDELTLTATVAPTNATNKTVTWTSSDENVATVANGVVTAKAAGTAIITATATNGTADTNDDKTRTCTVTVSPQTYNVTVKEGTYDAAKWSATPNPATAGQTVTIKYNGTKHVKSIKAVKKDAAADDLGLSVKWADMNLGAEKESDYGDFYAWGETETYYSSLNPITWKEGKSAGYTSSNGWPSYKYHDGSAFTKYTGSDKTVLDAEDDAVVQKLGGGWRLPTKAEWEELLRTSPSYTGADKIEGYEWKTELVDGHVGYRITRTSNGANIFLPAAGECYDTALRSQGTNGLYWSSTLADSDVQRAWSLNFTSSKVEMDDDGRFRGYSIRPVQSKN